MAWPFRQPDPDPEKEKKIAEQSKVERDEFISSLRTSFEETLKPIREDIDALKTSSTRTVPPERKQDPPPDIPSVLDNEDAAFGARLGPIAAQTVMLNARMTETEVLSDISAKGWGHLVPQIREVLEKQTPLQTKAGQGYRGYVENVADMLIGKEAKAKGLKFDGNKQTFFLEDASGGNNTPANSKMRQLEVEANDGKIDILHGRTLAKWAQDMGIKDIEALGDGN